MSRRQRYGALEIAIVVAFFAMVISVIVGVMLLHSKLVYHNYRCAFAHCRIIQINH